MERFLRVFSVSLCATLVAGAACAASETMTEQEKRSYAIGANVARNLKQQGHSVDPALVAKGLLDEMKGESLLTEAEVAAIIQQLRSEAEQKQKADQQKAAAENKRRGAAFLAENAKKEGVKTLPGGVQYKVLQAGNGQKPNDEDTVLCNYRGMLVDGTVFDSTQPGKPARLSMERVIPGWREALTQMPVGSTWELVIPAEKAYGKRGAGGSIGPNETLVFEVDLVGIE